MGSQLVSFCYLARIVRGTSPLNIFQKTEEMSIVTSALLILKNTEKRCPVDVLGES